MTWSSSRRFFIIAIIVMIALAVTGGIATALLYKAPSCSDDIMNRDEAGIDCGGTMCTYLCSADVSKPSVVFARALSVGARTDVVAYVENPNPSAFVRRAEYTIELFGPNHEALALSEGVMDLPAGEGVPIFIPNLYEGDMPATAFLTFNDSSLKWQIAGTLRTIPRASETRIGGTAFEPRVTATITNPLATAFTNMPVVATLFDASGNVIAASQTILSTLPPQGAALVTFTWNEPFSSAPKRIEVRPLVMLP